MSTANQPHTPGWLRRVQEQSWEPEILISGIVLFALFQIPPQLEALGRFLNSYSFTIFSRGTLDNSLIGVLYIATYWLMAGFTAHLIFRSIWVAYVGLSYVYPKGVDIDKLKYKPAYLRLLRRNENYQASILKLEGICSTIFAMSFLLFMCVIGVFFFLCILALLIGVVFKLNPELLARYQSYIDPVLSTLLLIFLFDFVTLGLLKRIPYISRIYYPLYRLVSLLTLSPLYRNIYYGLVSNHKRWKVGLWMLSFVVISLFLSRSVVKNQQWLDVMELKLAGSDQLTLFHGHYDNLMGEDPSSTIHIPSDIIEGSVLKVFVVHKSGLEQNGIFPICDYEQWRDSSAVDQDSLKLACMSSFYQLELNDSSLSPVFHYHKKQQTGQVGLVGYLNIAGLPPGLHELSLHYAYEERRIPKASVEFYRVE